MAKYSKMLGYGGAADVELSSNRPRRSFPLKEQRHNLPTNGVGKSGKDWIGVHSSIMSENSDMSTIADILMSA